MIKGTVYIIAAVMLSPFSNLHAEDLGFRFQESDLACRNEKREIGLNPKFLGQCALWDESDLAGKDLSNTDFRGGSFRNADLSKANLSSSDFSHSTLVAADLTDANATETKFVRAALNRALLHANLTKANLSAASMEQTSLAGATLTGAMLNNLKAEKASFQEVTGDNVVLHFCDCRETDFSSAKLSNSDFWKGNFERSIWNAAELDNVTLSDSRLLQVVAQSVVIKDSNWQGVVLSGAVFSGSTITSSDFSNTKLYAANFDQAQISEVNLTGSEINQYTTLPFTKEELAAMKVFTFTAHLATGYFHTCSHSTLGTMHCFGQNIGLTPKPLSYLEQLKMVSGGGYHTCGIGVSGNLYCWGNGMNGQLGNGLKAMIKNPSWVRDLKNVTHVATGERSSIAIDSAGDVFAFGAGYYGQLGTGDKEARLIPTKLENLQEKMVGTAMGQLHSCLLGESGKVYCSGDNQSGQLGTGDKTQRLTHVPVQGLPEKITAITAGAWFSCALGESKKVYCFGHNFYGELGTGETSAGQPLPQEAMYSEPIEQIAGGYYHTCAIGESGALHCVGRNHYGQLGDGSMVDKSTPFIVPGFESGVQQVSGTGFYTCALSEDGLFCFGRGNQGQLGTGSTATELNPVPVLFPE